ncbi:BlaI/MecI/CopY family transcriptional regulator [Solirubrobacter sp. CPCC 204708]|uniref:BlaI/MecI/CopY family transcriptional regulator n=1 Tax=Solirubrobacter deserti TaxID=2282478 RepID=A0ABT4RPC5_9ACTN|nr:BlaI/MecI/CopY family transcriptional regulator [Solirubrobacter deserti]MBE2315700.1 BlaI/MecI/CopY family transcriptional regulator [Solirubrobacter deserti]MDA0140411.1 BlaI/MecI/CopY family transcriptional regulator [Solirubrobacter deserti]
MAGHPPLHELETKIMAAVWEQGEATVRSVTDALADDPDGPRSYTTILTVMVRLDRKGFLDRRREGKKDVYAAAVDREAYMRARSEVEVDALVDAYGDLALTEFARRFDQLTPAHQRALRRRARGG